MCFKAKVSTPKVKTADIVAPPEPLKEAPEGVQFGGMDEDDDNKGTSSEVSGISDLKVKPDNSIKKSQSGTIKTSSKAKSVKRSSFFGS